MGETTPPPEFEEAVPEDNFPKVFSMTSNSYTKRGLNKSMNNLSKSKTSLNSEEEQNRPPAAKREKEQSNPDLSTRNVEKDSNSKATHDDIKSTKINESMPNLASNNVPLEELSKSENDLRTNDTLNGFGTKETSKEVFSKTDSIPNDINQEKQVNGDIPTAYTENTSSATKDKSENIPLDETVKKEENDEIKTKTKGARRDLGSVAEKLINKNKIKKMKSKRVGRAKSIPPGATQNEERCQTEEQSSNNDNTQPKPEPETTEANDIQTEQQVPVTDAINIPKESNDAEESTSSTRKSSNTSRKRHLEASTDNLNQSQSSHEDEKESKAPSDVTSEPTAKTKSSNGGGQQLILLLNRFSTDVRLIYFSKLLCITFSIVCFTLIIIF